MSQSSPLKSILKTSLPAVIDLSSQTIMWTIEAILIGQLSAAAFAGVGVANQLVVVILTVLITFIVGATLLITRLLGAGEIRQANHILGQALMIGVLLSIIIAVFLYFSAPLLFKIIRESENSQLAQGMTSQKAAAAGIVYARTVALFIPIIITNFIAIGIIRGAGDTHLSMLVNVSINGLNLFLAPALIFGLFWFPRLEVQGAALALGISHSVGFIITLYLLRTRKSVLFLSLKELMTPNLLTFKRLFKKGFPTTIEQMVWAIGMLVVTGYAALSGIRVLATHLVFVKMQAILSMAYLGFGMGAMTIMGKNLGAAEHRLAEKMAKLSSRIVFVFSLLVVLIMISFSQSLISIFTDDKEVLRFGAFAIVMFAMTQIPKAFNGVIIGNLRGAGDLKWLMWSTIIGVICFEIGLNWFAISFIDKKIYIVFVLWAVQGLDEAIRSSINFLRFKGGKWKLIDNF